MNLIEWTAEYNHATAEPRYKLYFTYTVVGLTVNICLIIYVKTMIKWYTDYSKHHFKIYMIKEVRNVFAAHEFTIQGEKERIKIPLKPAKEIVEDFLDKYLPLLG